MSELCFGAEGNHDERRPRPERNRRRFLQELGAGAVAAVSAPAALCRAEAAQGEPTEPQVSPADLPKIKIGKYELTRLIVGSNPISGYSHSTLNLANHMQEYFTLERTVEFITRCEKAGINAWQSGHGPTAKIVDTLKTIRQRGSKMHWFCLAWDTPAQPLDEILALKPIAVVHHGGHTDALFHKNRAEQVHDFVKRVHDGGVMACVSSHNPANIAYMEEKGWENEFFMTCLYHVSRPAEEIRAKLGTVPLGEPFFESDPEEMTAVIQRVKRPCLAFKILAAGRLCWKPQSVEAAFQYAFSRIKKTDGAIVGMYPRFSDELAHNVQLTLKYGKLS